VATWWNELFKSAFHSVGVERLASPSTLLGPHCVHVVEDCVIVPPSSWHDVHAFQNFRWTAYQSLGCESCSGSVADAVDLTCG